MNHIRKNIQAHMEKLCLDIGTRHCGSPGDRLAADYIEEYFVKLGLDVISESFPVRGWEFESFSLYNVTKDRPVPYATACFFSGPVDIEDTLLILSKEDTERLSELPVAGRICFVVRTAPLVWDNNRIAEELEKLGAAAVIFNSASQVSPSTKLVRSPYITRIATAGVNALGGEDILANSSDTYRLKIKARSFDTYSRNVIGRMGKGPKKGVIGAHYDTTALVQGASDNASGTVILMELARLLREEDLPLTLDFAAFSAEEYIPVDYPVGSKDYVRRHKSEDIRWYFNLDDFCGKGQPVVWLGHSERLPALTSRHPIKEAPLSGDDRTFFYAGIPTAWIFDGSPLLHTVEDTVETVSYDGIAAGLADMKELLLQLIRAEG